MFTRCPRWSLFRKIAQASTATRMETTTRESTGKKDEDGAPRPPPPEDAGGALPPPLAACGTAGAGALDTAFGCAALSTGMAALPGLLAAWNSLGGTWGRDSRHSSAFVSALFSSSTNPLRLSRSAAFKSSRVSSLAKHLSISVLRYTGVAGEEGGRGRESCLTRSSGNEREGEASPGTTCER